MQKQANRYRTKRNETKLRKAVKDDCDQNVLLLHYEFKRRRTKPELICVNSCNKHLSKQSSPITICGAWWWGWFGWCLNVNLKIYFYMILNQTLATIITSLGYMSYLSILPNLLLIHFAQFNNNTNRPISLAICGLCISLSC